MSTTVVDTGAAQQGGTAAPRPVLIQELPPSDKGGSFSHDVQKFGSDWAGFAGIVFSIVFIAVFWRLLRTMPRTKPTEIRPDAGTEVVWEEIEGAGEAKRELQEVVDLLKNPGAFERFGAVAPSGVLLHGPPGTGKTMLAKAVAHESGAMFFSQSASSFVEMFAGLGAARIRRLFREARKHAPAIVFIDELDAIGARRGSDMNSEREQTLNQLLVEMDGFESGGDVVVMAASNLLEKLDPALLRPGRFDRQVFVSPPDVLGRERILAVHTRGKPLSPGVDLALVAQQTSGLTGAELANIANEAAIFAARRAADMIAPADFEDAIERVVAGVQSNATLTPAERRIVAFHEAGHALCRELLHSTERVHKISIVPRGQALGYVLNLPDEDSHLKTREQLIDQMAVLMGGRVAEAVVFGEVTTGAASDLQRVAEITSAMVNDYGMGTTNPSVRAVAGADLVSDLTRRIRDEEQQELAFEAQRRAYELISAHRATLDALAEGLLAGEVLERRQIDAIMAAQAVTAGDRIAASVPTGTLS